MLTYLLKVHGETGQARTSPARLAQFLKLDPQRDVHACMEALARYRAQACLDALVAEGVPPEQLLVSTKAMGGNVRVDFIPELLGAPEAAPPSSSSHSSSNCEARCRELEEDKRKLYYEIDRLKRELASKPGVVTDGKWEAECAAGYTGYRAQGTGYRASGRPSARLGLGLGLGLG